MKSHQQKGAKFLALGFAGVVLAISASTSFAFFYTYFPTLIPAGVADVSIGALVSGVVGVSLFDLACFIWLLLFLNDADTPEQRAISIGMVIATFVGSSMASVAYLGLTATGEMALDATTSATIGTFALIIVMIGVILNFGAVQAYSASSQVNKKKIREADMRDAILKEEERQEDQLLDAISKKVAEKMAGYADYLSELQANAVANNLVQKKEGMFLQSGVESILENTAAPTPIDPRIESETVVFQASPSLQTGHIGSDGAITQDGGTPLSEQEIALVRQQAEQYRNSRSNNSNFPLS